MEAYVRTRWPELTAQRTYGAMVQLCREIHTVFRVKLAPRTLRPIIRGLKGGEKLAQASSVGSAAPPVGAPGVEAGVEEQTTGGDSLRRPKRSLPLKQLARRSGRVLPILWTAASALGRPTRRRREPSR